jgi:hypothetical protein
MARSTNLTKRLKDIEDIINPPKLHKVCEVLHTEDGYICHELKINKPSKKKVINKALKKASKLRKLYIIVLDLRPEDSEENMEVSNIDLNEEYHDRKTD